MTTPRGSREAGLCAGCNRGIALLRDDPALLRRAAAYLEGRGRIQPDERMLAIQEALARKPGASLGWLAQELGISRHMAFKGVHRLLQLGIMRRARCGSCRHPKLEQIGSSHG